MPGLVPLLESITTLTQLRVLAANVSFVPVAPVFSRAPNAMLAEPSENSRCPAVTCSSQARSKIRPSVHARRFFQRAADPRPELQKLPWRRGGQTERPEILPKEIGRSAGEIDRKFEGRRFGSSIASLFTQP